MSTELKQRIWNACLERSKEKYSRIQVQIEEARSALLNETKSSAGDKHETSRAMIQLEMEKLGHQANQLKTELHLIQHLPIDKTFSIVQTGALVKTNKGSYFIGPALGQLELEGELIWCISPKAPIAQAFIGKTSGESASFQSASFQSTTHRILEVH